MTKRVKTFVEEFIEEIELQQWEELFHVWYLETDVDEFWEDDKDFLELLQVLKVLNAPEDALRDARKNILEEYTRAIVRSMVVNHRDDVDSWNIYWSDVLMELDSLLGFTQEDIFSEIFNELEIAGVTPDYSNERFYVSL